MVSGLIGLVCCWISPGGLSTYIGLKCWLVDYPELAQD